MDREKDSKKQSSDKPQPAQPRDSENKPLKVSLKSASKPAARSDKEN
jgi:hypothetical protein